MGRSMERPQSKLPVSGAPAGPLAPRRACRAPPAPTEGQNGPFHGAATEQTNCPFLGPQAPQRAKWAARHIWGPRKAPAEVQNGPLLCGREGPTRAPLGAGRASAVRHWPNWWMPVSASPRGHPARGSSASARWLHLLCGREGLARAPLGAGRASGARNCWVHISDSTRGHPARGSSANARWICGREGLTRAPFGTGRASAARCWPNWWVPISASPRGYSARGSSAGARWPHLLCKREGLIRAPSGAGRASGVPNW